MQAQNENITTLDNLKYLPGYAQFLLDEKLDALAEVQLRIIREIKLPMLHYFRDFSEEQMLRYSKKTNTEILSYLARNEARQQIEDQLKNWSQNQLVVDQEAVSVDDIVLTAYLRKKSYLYFLPDYVDESHEMVELVKEIDLFLLQAQRQATNQYIQLLKDRIEQHVHFIERITNTTPGIIYVYSLEQQRELYANQSTAYFLGYSPDELKTMGNKLVEELMHPDDQARLKEYDQEFTTIRDGEVRSFKYRMKNRGGEYRWLRTYETVFKRDQQGEIIEKIGIAIDVTEQKLVADELTRKDVLYRQAQALAKVGNWAWDISSDTITWSDELFRMFGIEKKDAIGFQEYSIGLHPDDRERVVNIISTALKTHQPFSLEHRLIRPDGEVRYVSARGEVLCNELGEPVSMMGITQDVTEKELLFHKMKESELLYKQAQALANVGNYSFDLSTQQITWSDELFRIYGLEPQSEEITAEKYIAFLHPDDRLKVQAWMQEAIQERKLMAGVSRIVRRDGVIRYIESAGQVVEYANGKKVMVGVAQDITEKYLMIEQLSQSEALYKQAQSLASIGNWTMDLPTKSFVCSDEIFRIYEVEPQQVFGYEEWLSFLHPDEKDAVLQYLQDCIETGQSYDKVHRIVLPDGRIKTLHRKAEIVYDSNGSPVKMIGTTQDISEQYRVQQELLENQNFIRKIADATPAMISSYHAGTGKFVFLSEGITKLLGYKVEEAFEHGVGFFLSIIHPEDLDDAVVRHYESVQEANKRKQDNYIAEFTYRMRHKDGSFRWYHTYGTVFDRNAEGDVQHILSITIDVTDQKEATQKIKEQEYFIQQIADASPTILYLFDVDTQSMVYMNREVFFVLGFVPEELLEAEHQVTDTMVHPDDWHLLPGRKQSQKNFQQVDSMIQYECRLKNKEGDYRWFLVREIVFKTGDKGEVKQILGAALDINRRKEMERTILQNTMLLEQSNSSLEEFAYVASHDLKEPLRKISTFGDRLMSSQGDVLSSDGKIYLSKIIDASQRMQVMINDLLSISMISGNRSFERYSLQRILEETVQTLEYKIEQKGAVIQSTPLPEANIIPSQFRQLFQNLLSNSLKFMKPDVQPVIDIQHNILSQEEVVHYQLSAAEKYLKLVFSDNGIGFENEFAGKIFAIFQRLHGRSEYEGSGIGLAICKKIVSHHGGIIYAEGEPEVGARFTIILPA